MRRATLTRNDTGDEGTFGELLTDTGAKFFWGELPWRDNKHDRSCIPDGVYVCTWRKSPKFGFCYHVENVPGRSDILIHAANYVGDTKKKKRADVLGCMAPGEAIGELNGQRAVLRSRDALATFIDEMNGETFLLTIVWAASARRAA